ncbi:MAG: hypothetical protein PUC88_00030 [Clostridia bacterium]|nr:hypothetical protein [Clostridia bacterium]
MKCENSFCIYQFKSECLLDKVDIDSLGMCTECIYPDIDEEILNRAKLKLLRNYKKQIIIERLVLSWCSASKA